MKALYLLLLLSICVLNLQAQTYYYVNALEVIPETPTSEDEVSIHVFGDLSSTGSYITGHTIEIIANEVFLDINCASGPGLTVLVPFDTVFTVGTGLLAGDYTIALGGTALGDFVSDSDDYNFTVSGVDGLEEQVQAAVLWKVEAGQLLISNSWLESLQLLIYDVRGRQLIAQELMAGSTETIELSSAKGPLFLSFEVGGLRWGERISH